jgi:hypothetical protein
MRTRLVLPITVNLGKNLPLTPSANAQTQHTRGKALVVFRIRKSKS